MLEKINNQRLPGQGYIIVSQKEQEYQTMTKGEPQAQIIPHI